MSTIVEQKNEEELSNLKVDKLAYNRFWTSNSKRGKVFRLLIQGKNLLEIQTEAHVQIDFIKKTTSNPFFLKRLETYLLQILFNYQVNRILATDELFKHYWDIVMGRKIVEGLSIDQASKHLGKLLELKEVQPQVINPKQFNIIMQILKTDGGRFNDIATEFGFEKLQLNSNERPVTNSQMDNRERN